MNHYDEVDYEEIEAQKSAYEKEQRQEASYFEKLRQTPEGQRSDLIGELLKQATEAILELAEMEGVHYTDILRQLDNDIFEKLGEDD